MRLPGSISTWSIAVSLLAFGCTPSIGDACKLHTDCSATGNRLCEPNLPGGYCTIFNCEQDSCPSEAACVAFGIAPSAKLACAVTQQQRLERTFCMARCSSDSSCRSGYACVDLAKANNSNATVVDKDRGTQVCTVPPTNAADHATSTLLGSAGDQVCMPPDASFSPELPPPPGYDAAPSDAMSVAPRDGAPLPSSDARVPLVDASRGSPDAQGGP